MPRIDCNNTCPAVPTAPEVARLRLVSRAGSPARVCPPLCTSNGYFLLETSSLLSSSEKCCEGLEWSLQGGDAGLQKGLAFP